MCAVRLLQVSGRTSPLWFLPGMRRCCEVVQGRMEGWQGSHQSSPHGTTGSSRRSQPVGPHTKPSRGLSASCVLRPPGPCLQPAPRVVLASATSRSSGLQAIPWERTGLMGDCSIHKVPTGRVSVLGPPPPCPSCMSAWTRQAKAGPGRGLRCPAAQGCPDGGCGRGLPSDRAVHTGQCRMRAISMEGRHH